MTYEDWLSKQSISPVSPEAYWAELAWLEGYKQGLLLGNHKTVEGAWKYTQELIVNTFEYPKFEDKNK